MKKNCEEFDYIFHSGPVAFHSGLDEKNRPAVRSFSANQIASFIQLKIKHITTVSVHKFSKIECT